MKINLSIFHDYDIRGIYPTEINEETYNILGKAIATFFRVQDIAVGYDARLSSPKLFSSLTEGIMSQGTDVVDLGQISTEVHYFASGYYKFPANIIISASHNPAEYNGLKIVTKGAVPIHGEYGLPEIKKLATEQKFAHVGRKGSVRKMDILDEWIKHALSFINPVNLKPLKVVIDAGNGMGGISWQKIMNKLPVEIVPMYFEPDGHFPHHLPDPLKSENIRDLQKEILQQKADLGFAMDGDADRFFVLDDKGNPLSGTITAAILSSWLITKYGKAPVLYNVVCGRIVPETVNKLGGTPVRVRVGHSFIKQYMKKYHALFAGEHSGHFYFRDNFFADSSFIPGLLFLEFLSSRDMKLSEIAKEFDKYPQSGEINYRVKDTVETMANIKKQFADPESSDETDGLSVMYKDWWFNLRASKTEPLLRLNLEADNKRLLDDKIKNVESLLISLGAERAS